VTVAGVSAGGDGGPENCGGLDFVRWVGGFSLGTKNIGGIDFTR